jgi:hyaluronoglucosaminidase
MRRLLLMAATVALAAGMVAPVAGAPSAGATTGGVAKPAPDEHEPTVTPTPQQMKVGHGRLVVPPEVRLVAGEEVDQPTLDAVGTALRAAGVKTIRREDPGTAPRGPFTVTVGDPAATEAVADRLEDLEAKGPEGLPAEGYVLATGRTRTGAHAVLAGVDTDGIFYAAKTLGQVLRDPSHGPSSLPVVEIRDWPALALRGTIEGFYGTPWTHEQRLRQMDFYGDTKMNVYTYAPKDDPYHRERWDEPYPAAELDRLGELVDRGRANRVDFVFALSPGLSICYSSEDDVDALLAKFESVYDIGVRQFNVALDDINYTDWECPEDPARFGTGAAGAGAAQAFLLNQVVERFVSQHPDVERVQMVPTEYYNVTESPYKKALREQMDDSVLVQWTGIGVVPAAITTAQAKAAVAVFGHDIHVWDNYPVNDYAAGQLLLGPFNGREAGLSDVLHGLVANPMNQAEASKIPLVTVADYLWNDKAYDPEASLAAALRYVTGGDPALTDALRRFVDVNYASILNPDNAPELAPLVDAFMRELDDDGTPGPSARVLARELEALGRAPGVIRDRLENPLFLDEVGVWLDATVRWAEASRAAVEMLRAQAAGDGEAAWAARRDAVRAAAAARALRDDTVPHSGAAPKVGTGVLDVFVDKALARNDAWLGVSGDRATGTSTLGTYQDNAVARMVDGNLDTFYWSSGPPSAGDSVGVDLGAVTEIDSVDLAMSKPSSPRDYIQSGVLETSTDGSAWTSVGSFDDQPEISVDLPAGTQARYVRFRATAGQAEWVVVREFAVGVVGGVTRTVSGAPPAATGSSLDAAADGDADNAYVASRAPEPGEALTVEYSRAMSMSAVVVVQDPAEPSKAAVEVRAGGTWQRIGLLDGGYSELPAPQGEIDGIRLVWAQGASPPTVFEIAGWVEDPTAVTIAPEDVLVEPGKDGSTAVVTVTAHSVESRRGTLAVAVPAGWKADPARRDIRIGRGQPVVVHVRLTASSGATAAGEMKVTVEAEPEVVTGTATVRLVPPVDDENLARGGTATASSVEQDLPQFVPASAVDGDATTRWSSGHTDDQWLQVELAEPARLGAAVLQWETACARAYEIQASTDGRTWRTLSSVDSGDCGRDEARFDSGDPVRYVRMQGVARATSYGYSLYEFEVYAVR